MKRLACALFALLLLLLPSSTGRSAPAVPAVQAALRFDRAGVDHARLGRTAADGYRLDTAQADTEAVQSLPDALEALWDGGEATECAPDARDLGDWRADFLAGREARFSYALHLAYDPPLLCAALCGPGGWARARWCRALPEPRQQLRALRLFAPEPAPEYLLCIDGDAAPVRVSGDAAALLYAALSCTALQYGLSPARDWPEPDGVRYTAQPDGEEAIWTLALPPEPGAATAVLCRRDAEGARICLLRGAAVQARLAFAFEQALEWEAAP